MKTPPEQLALLRAVMAWQPNAWIFGGFAEDALLHGRSSRRHEDVDVVVFRDELPLRLDQARALGYDEVHVRLQQQPDRPLVVGCWNEDGALLELSIFERDGSGRAYFEKPTPDGPARLYFPEDAFRQPPSPFEGIEIRTVSARTLYHIRAGVVDLFGGMREKDVVAQEKLRKRFFADVPEVELAPYIVPASSTRDTRRHAGAPTRIPKERVLDPASGSSAGGP